MNCHSGGDQGRGVCDELSLRTLSFPTSTKMDHKTGTRQRIPVLSPTIVFAQNYTVTTTKRVTMIKKVQGAARGRQ